MQLAYRTSELRGIASPGFTGAASSMQALARLLIGTGVSYTVTGANTVTISQANSGTAAAVAGAIPLDTIDVQGDQQSPYGPGVGFVATRSTAGSKTDTPIIETPQSIDVVTRGQIEAQGAQTVPQALRYSSGVIAESRGVQSAWDNIYIRGFGSGATGNQYLNGMHLPVGNFATYQADPYLLDRVEILKGPASVLYGQNSPGGIVNFITKQPTETPLHEVLFTAGNFKYLQGAFDFSGPVDKDGKLLYRITGIGRATDTQVDFTKEQRVAIAPSLTWKPDADTSLTLFADYQHDPAGGYSGFLPALGTITPSAYGRFPRNFFEGDPNYNVFRRTQYGVGYMLRHDLNDSVSFRQNVRYTHVDVDYRTVFGLGWDDVLPHTLDRTSRLGLERLDGAIIDNQIVSKFDTGPFRHTLLVGIDAQKSWWREQDGFGDAAPLDVLNPVYFQTFDAPTITGDSKQTLSQLGLYAQDQIRIENWVLALSGREDWAQSNTTNHLDGSEARQSDKHFTGRAGLVYLFDNGLAPYVSYSTSFQPTLGTDFFNNPFKPTTGEQYEVGIKFQPKNSNSFVTLSAFDLTQQNVLTTDPDPSHIDKQIQTGEIRSRGIEVSGVANLSSELNLRASYTYLDARVTKSEDIDLGKVPLFTPRNTASLWADYTFQTGNAAGFGFGGGVRYIGTTYGDTANTFTVPAFTVFDAAVHYDLGKRFAELKGWQAAVNAANVFDRKYVASCTNSFFCIYGQGRTVLGTLKYRW